MNTDREEKEVIIGSSQNTDMKSTPPNPSHASLQMRDEIVTPVVSFVGNSDSGKTTLLGEVVRELKSRGYRVAVIKHSPHGFDMDQPGKDTWRHAQAGSDIVAVSSPDRLALIEHVDTELTLNEIAAFIGKKVDIVLTEGYKNCNTAKIVILGHEQSQEHLCCQGELLTTVSARPSSLGIPQFDYSDVINITNLLIKRIGDSAACKCGDNSSSDI